MLSVIIVFLFMDIRKLEHKFSYSIDIVLTATNKKTALNKLIRMIKRENKFGISCDKVTIHSKPKVIKIK